MRTHIPFSRLNASTLQLLTKECADKAEFCSRRYRASCDRRDTDLEIYWRNEAAEFQELSESAASALSKRKHTDHKIRKDLRAE